MEVMLKNNSFEAIQFDGSNVEEIAKFIDGFANAKLRHNYNIHKGS